MSREATVDQEEHEYDGPEPGVITDDQPGLSEEEAKAENEAEDDGKEFETEVNTYG